VIGDVVTTVCFLGGGLLALTAGAGLQRFDSVFARMHSATKPATLGLALIMIGAAFQMAAVGDVFKLLTVLVLQFVTAPLGAHLLGRSAYGTGRHLNPDTAVDELADAALR
jgi:multicomponent Na+:H+ antiporter subunit G